MAKYQKSKNSKMNVLVLGSGGREHAIAWKIKQSPILKSLYIAPGNAGTASLGENIPISPNNFKKTRIEEKQKKRKRSQVISIGILLKKIINC